MKKTIFFLVVLCSLCAFETNAQYRKTKVILLGCFHFDNPGLDVAKFANADILSAKRQQEVLEVVNKMKRYNPSKIFIENTPSTQPYYDSLLQQYKIGKFDLKASETYQLGFRLAKELNLTTLYPVDYRNAEFPFDSLMKSAGDAGQFDLIRGFKSIIDSVEKHFNESLQKNTITEMLLEQNTAHAIDVQTSIYYDLLVAGKKGNHVGSYLTSEWWRRNIIIYENILKSLDGKEECILVIFGSGHTALLHNMMKYNNRFELIPIHTILK
jgi:hypothetical protein